MELIATLQRSGGGEGGGAAAPIKSHQVILWDATVADADKYAPRDMLYAYAHYIGPTDPSSVGRTLDDGDLWTNNA